MKRLVYTTMLSLLTVSAASATPQQAAQIRALKTQVKKQQTAIAKRNATIVALKEGTMAQTEACRSLDFTRPFAGAEDTCETRVSALTSARDALQAALAGSVTDQLNLSTPMQVWTLMPTIYIRLGPPFTRSVFSSSGFTSYSFSN
jgi:hypothetical protein